MRHPYKGKVLTQISDFWFEQTKDIVPNHLIASIVYDFPSVCKPYWDSLGDRSMLWRRQSRCRLNASYADISLVPAGLNIRKVKVSAAFNCRTDLLNRPSFPNRSLPRRRRKKSASMMKIFHSINDQYHRQRSFWEVRDISLKVYRHGAEQAEKKGIIIADTKLEFGINESGDVILIDELLTPDSSRFWPKDKYEAGRAQESLISSLCVTICFLLISTKTTSA